MHGFPTAPPGLFQDDGNKPAPHGYGINWEDPLSDGLTAYYPIWEGAGSRGQDLVNNNHGTLSGATRVTSDRGPVLSIQNNQYVPLSRPVVWSNPNRLSLVASVRIVASGSQNRHTILGHNNEADAIQLEVNAQSSGNGWVSILVPGMHVARALGVWPADEWVNVAYTRSGSGAGNHAMYINGVPQALDDDEADNYSQATNVTEIGRRASGSQHLEGLLDQLSLYDRPLSEAEVVKLYQERYRLITPVSRTLVVGEAAVGNPWNYYQQMASGAA